MTSWTCAARCITQTVNSLEQVESSASQPQQLGCHSLTSTNPSLFASHFSQPPMLSASQPSLAWSMRSRSWAPSPARSAPFGPSPRLSQPSVASKSRYWGSVGVLVSRGWGYRGLWRLWSGAKSPANAAWLTRLGGCLTNESTGAASSTELLGSVVICLDGITTQNHHSLTAV